MRSDAIFIAVEVDDSVVDDADLAKKLDEACPVDIFDSSGGNIALREANLDECVLCRLCLDAAPAGTVKVLKLYDGETALA
ncbi:MAG: ferredoxin [Solirubrobacterales bacterium]|nr:ferredoxin [Solirubrobacterales bacterium]